MKFLIDECLSPPLFRSRTITDLKRNTSLIMG